MESNETIWFLNKLRLLTKPRI